MKTIKPIITVATVKNGKINWIAQKGLPNSKLKRLCECFGEKVITVKVIPIKEPSR